jgi:hypothetical protein
MLAEAVAFVIGLDGGNDGGNGTSLANSIVEFVIFDFPSLLPSSVLL